MTFCYRTVTPLIRLYVKYNNQTAGRLVICNLLWLVDCWVTSLRTRAYTKEASVQSKIVLKPCASRVTRSNGQAKLTQKQHPL